MKAFSYFLLLTALLLSPARAIENNGTYQTSDPTFTSWLSGWGAPGISGWDYVGTVNGASGVYLGNHWVMTAGHVGAGDFTLQGSTYNAVGGSTVGFGLADFIVYQIATAPMLPSLTLSPSVSVGNEVAMLGFGGGAESWGLNTVSIVNYTLNLNGKTSTTFVTLYGGQNLAKLVIGDSGGGDFIYDAGLGSWTLAGINDAVTGNGHSFMIELSQYAPAINNVITVPEPGSWALLGAGAILLVGLRKTGFFKPKTE